MREVGPGYIFLTKQETDSAVLGESTGVLWQEHRPYPALMNNPFGNAVEGRQIENDEVEMLGLERFSTDDCKRNFSYIILRDLDLTDDKGLSDKEAKRVSRPAFAFEQMCQYLTMDLELGYERLHRIPGAGAWNSGPGHYLIGFAFADETIKPQIGQTIAVVKGVMKWNGMLRCGEDE
jgi:hypothetical protein